MSKSKKSRVSAIFKQQLEGKVQAPPPAAAPAPVQAAPVVDQGVSPPKKIVNHAIFLLDVSQSMSSCFRVAQDQLNRSIDELRAASRAQNQETYVSVWFFGSGVYQHVVRQPIDAVSRVEFGKRLEGSTRLIDANVMAVQAILGTRDDRDPDTSMLLICVTDGGDNDRRIAADFPSMLRDCQQTDRWTFAYMVPNQTGVNNMVRIGVPDGNVTTWDNTARGAEIAGQVTVTALNNYVTTRSTGQKSTTKFYVDTDLSKLTKNEVETKLQDLTGRFKFSTVDKEVDIKAFAESVTGKSYVIGSFYYALTKRETIQATKDVVIVEKGTRKTYGGPEARRVLGLPAGSPAQVNPGNHANWDVYVKSTSVNRKLVRGTKVLIDLLKTTPDAETWDSAAALAAAEAKRIAAQGQPTT